MPFPKDVCQKICSGAFFIEYGRNALYLLGIIYESFYSYCYYYNIIVCISSILLTIYLDEIIPVFSSWAIGCIWCIFILGAEWLYLLIIFKVSRKNFSELCYIVIMSAIFYLIISFLVVMSFVGIGHESIGWEVMGTIFLPYSCIWLIIALLVAWKYQAK